jgi:hypothetical protein
MATTLHIGDRGPDVERLQIGVNGIIGRRRFPWRKIEVDEVFGDDTQKAARFAGWLLGFDYQGKLADIKDGKITPSAFAILVGERAPTNEMKERIKNRKPKAREMRVLHKRRKVHPMPGVTIFEQPDASPEDQKMPVASWMVPFLKKSQKEGWDGHVISGFRSPEESTKVCMSICGRPTCSATATSRPCAGATSRHSGRFHPDGAIDINPESQLEFAAIQRRIGSPLRNNVPGDENHFSTGN